MKNKIKSILLNKEFIHTLNVLSIVSGIVLGAILINNPKSFDTMDIVIVGIIVIIESITQLFKFISSNKTPKRIHYKDFDEIDFRDFK